MDRIAPARMGARQQAPANHRPEVERFTRGDNFKSECPTGSGNLMNLFEVAKEISNRLTRIFVRDESGRRPVNGGTEKFQTEMNPIPESSTLTLLGTGLFALAINVVRGTNLAGRYSARIADSHCLKLREIQLTAPIALVVDSGRGCRM